MRSILFFAVSLLLFPSCKNLVPYSDALKSKYHLQSSDLMRVQFYVSDPIVLQRKFTDGSAEVVKGKVKIVNGEKVEEVIIPSGTPGVLVREADGKLEVSFEKSDANYLRFGGNPNKQSTFVLLASDWRNKIGTVTYGGEKFFTSPESADALLLIDLKKIQKFEKSQRVAGGRKVQ